MWDILKNKWQTDVKYAVTMSSESQVVRAFYGTYNISLLYDGVVKESQDVNFIKGVNTTVQFVLK